MMTKDRDVSKSEEEQSEIQERYRVVKPLNSGSFAEVDLAVDAKSGGFVALKRISKSTVDELEPKDHPNMEALVHRRLSRHPNIVELKGHYETETEYVLVMEYAGPTDLFEHIHRQGNLDDASCRAVFLQILNSVEYCHSQGVYHRDIKPENVMIDSTRGFSVAKLCDFGLATMDAVSVDYGYGSVAFMAPEVFGDYRAMDGYFSAPADVWALGVLLFNMRFGVLPWSEPSRSNAYFQAFLKNPEAFQMTYDLSTEFMALLRSALDPNPYTRISVKKFKVMFEALGSFVRDRPKSKRRLSMDTAQKAQFFPETKMGRRRDTVEGFESWAEDDGEMDYTKPLQFGDQSIPVNCGLSAHLGSLSRSNYLSEMY